MLWFKQDVRLQFNFSGCPKTKRCHKKIYVKSTWQPNNASEEVKECMTYFEHDIWQKRAQARSRPNATNLSEYQFACLQHLRQSKTIIVLMSDKNLGPVVMLKTTYIESTLQEHLLDGKGIYRRILEKPPFLVQTQFCRITIFNHHS